MVEDILLKNVVINEELRLGMVSTPHFILKSVDWGTIKSQHYTYKYVNQIGVTISGSSLKTRSIVIEGWIIADTDKEMSERKSKLNMFVSPFEPINLVYKDYMIQFIPDETVKYATDSKDNNETISKFQIKGTAPNPLFSNSYESRATIAATIPTFHFPFISSKNLYPKGVIFGKRTNSLIAMVVNKGQVDIGMRIVFKAKGDLTNPKLIDLKNQKRFEINKSMKNGEEIEINTNVGEKSVVGRLSSTDDYENYFMYKTPRSSWLRLAMGENLFRYDADSGLDNLEVYIYFSNQYMEVQECD